MWTVRGALGQVGRATGKRHSKNGGLPAGTRLRLFLQEEKIRTRAPKMSSFFVASTQERPCHRHEVRAVPQLEVRRPFGKAPSLTVRATVK